MTQEGFQFRRRLRLYRIVGPRERPGTRGHEEERGQEVAQASLAPACARSAVEDFVGLRVEVAEPGYDGQQRALVRCAQGTREQT